MTTRSDKRAGPREDGFTLLEVLVTLAILGYAVVSFQAIVVQSIDRALITKVNRQMRQLVEYQLGQITVGRLHPEEEDPFPDGQTGGFDDVGGYPEEYQGYSWKITREEIPICGTDEDELQEAGFTRTPDGALVRSQTDDILAGTDEHLEKPKGQFKSRVTLIVRWNGETAEEDREFLIVTYLPVNGEEDADSSGGAEGANAPGGAPADGSAPAPQAAGNASVDRSGSVNKEPR